MAKKLSLEEIIHEITINFQLETALYRLANEVDEIASRQYVNGAGEEGLRNWRLHARVEARRDAIGETIKQLIAQRETHPDFQITKLIRDA